jgi:hypothetical protein
MMHALVVMAVLALGTPPLRGGPPGTPPLYAGSSATHTTVGLEGKVIFRYEGAPIRALPVDDKAAVVVRIAEQVEDGGHRLYDLRFIAHRAGDYDLRSFLQHADGSPVTDGEAAPVHVGAVLPEEAGADLVEMNRIAPVRLGGYRTALIALGAAWAVPPIVILTKRLRRRKPAPAPEPARPLTLADQLRPLVSAALHGDLSTPDRARLEMLLLGYWRQRLGLREAALEEMIGVIRGDREGGPLVIALERWLHSPRAEHDGDLDALLGPYQRVGALPEAQSNREASTNGSTPSPAPGPATPQEVGG